MGTGSGVLIGEWSKSAVSFWIVQSLNISLVDLPFVFARGD